MSTKCRQTKSGQSGVKCTHNECTKEQSDTKLDQKTSEKKNEATKLNQIPRKSYWMTQYQSIEFGPNTEFFQNLIWQVNSIYLQTPLISFMYEKMGGGYMYTMYTTINTFMSANFWGTFLSEFENISILSLLSLD